MSRKPLIAVVGAGRMGIGIAQVFAYAGHRVHLADIKERTAEEAKRVQTEATTQVVRNITFLAELGVLSPTSVKPIVERIECFGSTQIPQALEDADVVFEAVPEVMEVKAQTFETICSFIGPQTWIASTTSTFLADSLASFITSPGRFLNTHWLNPAYLIPLVEVSPSKQTSSEVVGGMLDLLKSVGKVPVQCAPSPGYIVPRIQALAMNEAARIVEEGVATPAEIDQACRYGFGIRFAILGLLEFIDWGGGDILYYASHYLRDSLGSDRFAPPQIISRNMEDGKIGMKTGKGFYDFEKADVGQYQLETMRKFVDLLLHLRLLPKPEQGELTPK